MDASEKWMIICFTVHQTTTLAKWMFFPKLLFQLSLQLNGIQVRPPNSSNDLCFLFCLFLLPCCTVLLIQKTNIWIVGWCGSATCFFVSFFMFGSGFRFLFCPKMFGSRSRLNWILYRYLPRVCFAELGTRQYFSLTTTTRQRNRASLTRKNTKGSRYYTNID